MVPKLLLDLLGNWGRGCADPFGSSSLWKALDLLLPSHWQGLHPSVRTEAWKFLTGYYSWQSSQDERLTVDSKRR
jgi:hypothetical protein